MQHQTYNTSATGLPLSSLVVTLMASAVLIFVLIGATSYLYVQTSAESAYGPDSAIAYRRALEEASQTEEARREWRRLHKYHGQPAVVIYEEGKTPYFYDKLGNPCAFIEPPKATAPIEHPAKDGEYDVALMLTRESNLD